MTDHNPYAAPKSLSNENPEYPLAAGATQEPASPGQRFGAITLDTLIMMPVYLPIVFYVILPHLIGESGPVAAIGLGHMDLLTRSGVKAAQSSLMLLIFLLINGRLLYTSGQTIGKRLLKIRIVHVDGNRASMAALLKRFTFQYLIGVIPLVGSLTSVVDSLCVFTRDHRCIHDHLADTIVIKVNPQG